ncbi:MAG: aminotransferase class V-fold PLP-dependent enzyme [bacterium]|nr:aminotransferase class V-fold PLP-dependent enzyme [bacterium]
MSSHQQTEFEQQIPVIIGGSHPVPLLDGSMAVGIYFDNAASTKPFKVVSDFIKDIEPYYSNIHRGTGYDSIYCTHMYEEARKIILDFVGGDPEEQIVIPVRNTTEGLNLLAMTMELDPNKDVVITSMLEHHSNDLPWRDKAIVEYIPADVEGTLDLEHLEKRLAHHKGAVKVVSCTGASNVIGTVTPIHEIAALAHKYDARIVVDAAQLLPHRAVDMKPKTDPGHLDYLVFSAHKMNSPYGEGAVIGDFSHFQEAAPYLQGGGTVYSVGLDHVIWADPPDKQEAGTPNIFGMLAQARALQVMREFGMENIVKHEMELTRRFLTGLKEIPRIGVFGIADPDKLDNRLGAVTFTVAGMHHAHVAAILSYEGGICVRNGCFCAHPLIKSLLNITKEQEEEFEAAIKVGDRTGVPGAVRASFGLHNRAWEVDHLLHMLRIIADERWQGNYIQDRMTGEFLPEGFNFSFGNLPSF